MWQCGKNGYNFWNAVEILAGSQWISLWKCHIQVEVNRKPRKQFRFLQRQKKKKNPKKGKNKVKHPNPLNLLGLPSFNQFFIISSLGQTLMPVYWVFYLEMSFERKHHNMQCLYRSNMRVLVLQTGVSVAFIYLGQWW